MNKHLTGIIMAAFISIITCSGRLVAMEFLATLANSDDDALQSVHQASVRHSHERFRNIELLLKISRVSC